MTGLVLMLAMATAATAPTTTKLEQVLVLKTGSAMTVQSYAVDGLLIRIVGMTGEPLVLRADKVDLAASQQATDHRQRQPQAPAPSLPEAGPQLTSTRIRSESMVDASRRVLARGGRGGAMSTPQETAGGVHPTTDTRIGKYELAPGAREVVTASGTEAMTIGFRARLSAETLAACKAGGVRLVDAKGASVSSKTGASLTVEPIDGAVDVTVENLEEFPIAVEVYRK